MWIRFLSKKRKCDFCKKIYLAKSGRSLYCEVCREVKKKSWKNKYTVKYKEKIAIKRHLYDKTEQGKEKYRTYRLKIKEKSRLRYWSLPENKRKAGYYIHNAVRDKKLIKLSYCEKCGIKDWGVKRSMIEGHHYLGYNPKNWLKVKWLCTNCHKLADKKVGDVL